MWPSKYTGGIGDLYRISLTGCCGITEQSRTSLLRSSSLLNTCQMMVKVSFSKGCFLVPENLVPTLNIFYKKLHFWSNCLPNSRPLLRIPSGALWFKGCHLLVLRRKLGSDRAVHEMKPVLLPGSSASSRISATTQHKGKESRVWVTYKFLFLEAVTDTINHFLFFISAA